MKLSDMYEGQGDLECVATMININQGHRVFSIRGKNVPKYEKV